MGTPNLQSIFISYRRRDSAGHAGRLSDHLNVQLSNTDIFMDVRAIEPGEDWLEAIETAIQECNILLVVIGPDWLTLSDSYGRRRLDNPADIVRLEIKVGLQASHVRVVPILIGEAEIPPRNSLPGDIVDLAECNSFEISDETFREDVERLVTALNRIFTIQESSAHPMFVDIQNNERIDDWQHSLLGDLVEFIPHGSQSQIPSKIGNYPFYTLSGLSNYVHEPELDGEYLLVSTAGKGLIDRSVPVVVKVDGQFAASNKLFVIEVTSEDILIDYLMYYLWITDFMPFVKHSDTPELTRQEFQEIYIAYPPLEEQAAIVAFVQERLQQLEEEEIRLREEINRLASRRVDVMNQAFSGEI